MLTYTVHPRFGDTDQLGHIHHLTVPSWFEEARNPIFNWFNPGLKLSGWNLILARIEVDYTGQMRHEDQDVEIRTWVSYIGHSSFHLTHAAYSKGKCCALGGCVLIHYDFKEKRAVPIPEHILILLREHFCEDAPYKIRI